jgi:hypothetical protein
VLSGGTENVVVRQETGSTQVGSKQGQFWRIDDSDISINSTPFDSVAAEDSLNIAVKDTNGASVGSEVAGEWIVPAFEQDLVTRVNFDSGSPLEYTITVIQIQQELIRLQVLAARLQVQRMRKTLLRLLCPLLLLQLTR